MTFLLPTNRISRDIDRFFDGFCGFPGVRSSASTEFQPRVNIRENDDSIALTFELPGMDKKEIKVAVQDDILTVSGERKFKSEQNENGCVRTEIRTGSFSRSFTLPDSVDREQVTADYENGLLEITLAKKEEVKPQEIEVKVR